MFGKAFANLAEKILADTNNEYGGILEQLLQSLKKYSSFDSHLEFQTVLNLILSEHLYIPFSLKNILDKTESFLIKDLLTKFPDFRIENISYFISSQVRHPSLSFFFFLI